MILVQVDETEFSRHFEELEAYSEEYEYVGDEFVIRGRVFAPGHEPTEIATRLEESLVELQFEDDPPGPDDPPKVEGRRKVG